MTLEQQAAQAEPAPSTEPETPADDGSPEQDGAQQQPASQQSSKPRPQPSSAALMAANTRLSQSNAAIRRALGFDGKVSDKEILERIESLSSGGARSEDPEYDPAFDEERSQFIEREWRLAERVYGEDTVSVARNVQELALTAASPAEFLDELSKLIGGKEQGQQQQPQQGQQQPAQQPTPQQQRAADVAPEGDGPVDWTVQPEQDEVGSGDTEGAARKLFGSIFGGAR